MVEYTILLKDHDGIYIDGVGYKVEVSEDIDPKPDYNELFKTRVISYLNNFQNLQPYLSRAGRLECDDPNNKLCTLNINQDPEVRNLAVRIMNEMGGVGGGNINDIRSKHKRRKIGGSKFRKSKRKKSKRRKSKRKKSKKKNTKRR